MSTGMQGNRENVLTSTVSSVTRSTESVIFQAAVPMRVRGMDAEDVETRLELCVATPTIAICDGQSTQRILRMKLTSDQDHTVLYNLDVTEEAFQCLKTEQQILVDFVGFPAKFVELVQECTRSHVNGTNVFAAGLNHGGVDGKSTFTIIETNRFRHITHIKLQFRAASDAEIKRHLASRVTGLKSALADTTAQLDASRSALTDRETAFEKRLVATEQERARIAHDFQELRVKQASRINEERGGGLRRAEELQRQAEDERRRMEDQHRSEIAALKELLQGAREREQALDSRVQALTEDLKDRTRDLKEANELTRRLTASEQRFSEQLAAQTNRAATEQANGAELRVRHAALEQKVLDTERLQRQTDELLEEARRAKDAMEGTTGIVKANCARLEAEVGRAQLEVAKGNTIIKKLQEETVKLKAQVGSKSSDIDRLGCESLAHEQNARDLSLQNQSLQMKLECACRRAEEASRQNDVLRASVEETERSNRSRQQVIEWLNKELNEAQTRASPSCLPTAGGGGRPGRPHLPQTDMLLRNRHHRPKSVHIDDPSLSGLTFGQDHDGLKTSMPGCRGDRHARGKVAVSSVRAGIPAETAVEMRRSKVLFEPAPASEASGDHIETTPY